MMLEILKVEGKRVVKTRACNLIRGAGGIGKWFLQDTAYI